MGQLGVLQHGILSCQGPGTFVYRRVDMRGLLYLLRGVLIIIDMIRFGHVLWPGSCVAGLRSSLSYQSLCFFSVVTLVMIGRSGSKKH